MPFHDLQHRWIRFAPLALLLASGLALSSTSGPPASETGASATGSAPSEASCTSCHSGNTLNSGGTVEILGTPTAYKPDSSYVLTVRLTSTKNAGSTGRKWGFELTAVNQLTGAGFGTLARTKADTSTTKVVSGSGSFSTRRYVEQNSSGTRTGAASPVQWTVRWTAPNAVLSTAPVKFFAAGNAANGNGSDSGDWIYKSSVTVPVASVVGVEPAVAPFTGRLLPVHPNPARGRAQLGFDLARGGEVALELYDVTGRRVREIVRGSLEPGSYRYEWDGADDHGAPMPAGVYLVRFTAPGVSASQRVALIR